MINNNTLFSKQEAKDTCLGMSFTCIYGGKYNKQKKIFQYNWSLGSQAATFLHCMGVHKLEVKELWAQESSIIWMACGPIIQGFPHRAHWLPIPGIDSCKKQPQVAFIATFGMREIPKNTLSIC